MGKLKVIFVYVFFIVFVGFFLWPLYVGPCVPEKKPQPLSPETIEAINKGEWLLEDIYAKEANDANEWE